MEQTRLAIVAAHSTVRDDSDPLAPQREAALFYGLFLRGQSAESLRREIDLPKPLVNKWLRARKLDKSLKERIVRAYNYRKQVLAIFDELVTSERMRARVH